MKVFGFDFGDELDGCDTSEPERKVTNQPQNFGRTQDREFDAGVIPDLHCAEQGEQVAAKLGIEYVPGVGPILTSLEQAERYCRETGQAPKNAVNISRRLCRRNAFGHESKRTRKQVEVDWNDRSAYLGKQRRNENELRQHAAAHRRGVAEEAAARALIAEANRSGKYYSIPKP